MELNSKFYRKTWKTYKGRENLSNKKIKLMMSKTKYIKCSYSIDKELLFMI